MKRFILFLSLISVSASANPCRSSADCPGNGNVCLGGRCVLENTGQCRSSGDCGYDSVCMGGTCHRAGHFLGLFNLVSARAQPLDCLAVP